MGGSNSKTTVNYLISLIDRVHKIYEDTVWRDTPESGGFSNMGFIIKKIVVHRKPTQTRENEVHYNMFRSDTQRQGVFFYLASLTQLFIYNIFFSSLKTFYEFLKF